MSVARDTVSDSIDAVSDAAVALNCDGSAVAAARGSNNARMTAVLSTDDARPIIFVAALAPATMRPMSKISASRLVVIDVVFVVFVCHPLLGIVTRYLVIFAIWRLIAATARHAGVCALASHGGTTALHTMFVVAVQAVLTPAVHVEAPAQATHGALPEDEKVLPAAHATWHTASAVLVQAVLTPAVHVALTAHFVHGAFPEAEKVTPAAHATWHTVSVVVVHAVFTP